MVSNENEKKKIKIGAVIDFCSANGINWGKAKIFKFFDVPQATGYMWFPGTVSPNFRRPTQPADTPKQNKAQVKKHARSEDKEETSSAIHQNSTQNDGRKQKRVKTLIAEMETPSMPSAISSSPPEQFVTSTQRKKFQPGKKVDSRLGRHLKAKDVTEVKQEDWKAEIGA
jgi:hypothetical protein